MIFGINHEGRPERISVESVIFSKTIEAKFTRIHFKQYKHECKKGLYENGYGVKIIKSVDEAVEFWYEAFIQGYSPKEAIELAEERVLNQE